MSNIRQTSQNNKAFIPSITCGGPDFGNTKRNVQVAVAAGADLVELGIPFSDSTVEGPVIQAANLRALSGGVTTGAVFQMVAELREELTVPLVFMTYANVTFSYGVARFAVRAAKVGTDGIILPDVSSEKKEELAPTLRATSTDSISIVAPISMARIREIAAAAEGFFHVISSLGVTDVRQEISTDLSGTFTSMRQANPSFPATTDFGISTPTQTKRMAAVADGVIVGFVTVRIMAEKGCEADEETACYVREMKTAANIFQ